MVYRPGPGRAPRRWGGPHVGGDPDDSEGPRSVCRGRLGLAPRVHDRGHLVAGGAWIGDGLGHGLENRGAALGDEHAGAGTFEASPSGRPQYHPVLRMHDPPQHARTQVEHAVPRSNRAPQGQCGPGGDGEQSLGAVFAAFVDAGHVDAGKGVDALLLEAPPGPGDSVGHGEQALVDLKPARTGVGNDERPG